MMLNVINNELYEYREDFSDRDKKYSTISYLKILDYKLHNGGTIIEEINTEQVIEIDKYLKKEQYLSIKRDFVNIIPSDLKSIVNIVHQRKGGAPLSV